MKLQETYKPKDYHELIKSKIPVSYNTLRLICNNFEKLNEKYRKEINKRLSKMNDFERERESYIEKINEIEKASFLIELKIIEIFQRNNI